LVNGQPAATIDVADRGFQYGDGVFTTLPVRNGIPRLFRRHLDRIERDARRLAIPFPGLEMLSEDVRTLLDSTVEGVLKIMLTRGSGGRGYRPPEPVHPTRVVALHPAPDYPAELETEGVAVRVCRARLGLNPALAGMKHMNRLEQILARAEWTDGNVREGLMLDLDGWVVEGTMSNLFLVKDGRLATPRLDRCGVAGVTRALAMEAAAELALTVEEVRVDLADLAAADEAFLTNSVFGLWPIRRIEDQQVAVGDLTRRLAIRLNERVDRESNTWQGS
jgi:4-amino-4-deoxychorismate lyase